MPLVVVPWASRVYGICTLSKPCTWKPLVQLTCTMIQLTNVSQTVGGGPLATANTLVVLATMHPRVYVKIWGGTLLSAISWLPLVCVALLCISPPLSHSQKPLQSLIPYLLVSDNYLTPMVANPGDKSGKPTLRPVYPVILLEMAL